MEQNVFWARKKAATSSRDEILLLLAWRQPLFIGQHREVHAFLVKGSSQLSMLRLQLSRGNSPSMQFYTEAMPLQEGRVSLSLTADHARVMPTLPAHFDLRMSWQQVHQRFIVVPRVPHLPLGARVVVSQDGREAARLQVALGKVAEGMNAQAVSGDYPRWHSCGAL
jgi:hypothetical protein